MQNTGANAQSRINIPYILAIVIVVVSDGETEAQKA